MRAKDAPVIDIDTFLDGLKFNRFHLTVLVLCTLLAAIDGYELYVVGWVLPKLDREFSGLERLLPIPPFDGGHIVEGLLPRSLAVHWAKFQQVGMLVGAFIVPPLADRFSRPRILFACYAGMMLSALGILQTHSLFSFAALRFVAGFCGTAMIPILVTLVSEAAPTRLRATLSTITVAGTMIGSLIGAGMQAYVLEPFGWHGAFWIGALMPARIDALAGRPQSGRPRHRTARTADAAAR